MLALNAATRGVRPLRSRLAVTSSHIVLTEPVPDVLERIGWTGGESITDARTFVHYFRTTPDGRIAFGWGGGALACGARLNGRVERDPATAAVTAEHLHELFPLLAGRRLTHAWGGPIDVSPSHLPQVGTLSDGPVHYAFGFTGNGVGPSHLAGRILSGLALDARDADTRLALVDPAPAVVPPEPLAWMGGSLVRAAFLRRERIEAEGRRPDPLTRGDHDRAEGARDPRRAVTRSPRSATRTCGSGPTTPARGTRSRPRSPPWLALRPGAGRRRRHRRSGRLRVRERVRAGAGAARAARRCRCTCWPATTTTATPCASSSPSPAPRAGRIATPRWSAASA